MQMRFRVLILSILILILSALAAHAQRPVLFTLNVSASITVHRSPGTEHPIASYLEPGMTARVFACNADCTWLDIGPSVWIQSGAVSAASALPAGLSLPVSTSTQVPSLAPVASALAAASTAVPTATDTRSTGTPAQVTGIVDSTDHDGIGCECD
jgi:hypothetical protein